MEQVDSVEPVRAPPETGIAALTATEVWGMLQMRRRVVVAVAFLAVVITLVGTLLTPKRYKATAVIQIKSQSGQELRVQEVVDYDTLSRERTYTKTQVDLLQSRASREDVISRYEALGFGDLTLAEGGAEKLRKMLTVSPRRDTELIDVGITDTDPNRAARLANLVTEAYRHQALKSRQDTSIEAKLWLQQQLTEYKQRIVDEGRGLIAYQKANDLADADHDQTRLSSAMSDLNEAFGAVHTERVMLDTTVASHEKLKSGQAWEALAKDMNTPLGTTLAQEYSSSAVENARISAHYLEKMPERVYSDAKLAGLEAQIRKEVDRTLATEKAKLLILRAKEASLLAATNDAKSQLLIREGLHEEYERLKLELDRSKQFYSTLSQRDGELELAARTNLSNVNVVDDARPDPRVVSPDLPENLGFGLVAGILLGALIGFWLEYADNTISSPQHVSTYLRVPFLGIVPRLAEAEDDRKRALYIRDHPSSPASEALRSIRTVIEFNGKPIRRLMVTSSVPSEGKTNTIVSLAVSFATLGRKVLILDCDMRRPRAHQIFQIPKEIGLSTVLKGGSIDASIHPSGVVNLDVMPAGARTDGPNELLASNAMADLLTELDARYDLVLIDTPPSGMLSDAAILSKQVDGVVFVVREQTVSRRLVQDVVYRLQQVDAPIVGVIVNDVDLSKARTKYKYYYDYDYRYRSPEDHKPDVAAK
ncbi:MAG: polysaccharide biosynthesis tyrosine autokinase [Myxococcales bacterium]|nr:polysaccharide biosynthesis tyrosine autokinase [Myxococcales bacterium]